MKKLKIVLILSCLVISQSVCSEEETKDFDPFFSFGIGFSVLAQNDFKLNGITFDESELGLAISPTIGYQLTKDWGVSLQYSEYGFRFRTEENRDIFPAPLLNVRHGLSHYTLTGTYNIPVLNWLDLKLNAGLIIADDIEQSRECIEFSSVVRCNTWSPYEVNQQTKVSAIAGTSLFFKFSESWGLKLGYQYSPYRNGLTKTDLMIRYNF